MTETVITILRNNRHFLRLVPRHGTVCHLRCVASLCRCSVSNILWKHSCL